MFKTGDKVKLARPTGGKHKDLWHELHFSPYVGKVGKIYKIYGLDSKWSKVEGMGGWSFSGEWLSKTKRKMG